MCDSLDNDVHPAKRTRIVRPDDNKRLDTADLAHSGSSDHSSPVFNEQPYVLSLDINPSPMPSPLTQWVPAYLSPGVLIPPSEMLLPVLELGDNFEDWAGTSSVHNVVPESPTCSVANMSVRAQTPDFIQQSHSPAPATPSTSVSLATARQSTPLTEIQPREQRAQQSANPFTNPFTECTNTFGSYLSLQFPRPPDGKVNSYIKFNWVHPTHKRKIEELDDDDEISSAGLVSSTSNQSSKRAHSPRPNLHKAYSASSSVKASLSTTSPQPRHETPLPTFVDSPNFVSFTLEASAPQLVPAHFGHDSILDSTGRKLWQFCTARLGYCVL